LTDSIDYRTIGFSHNRPNPNVNVSNSNNKQSVVCMCAATFLIINSFELGSHLDHLSKYTAFKYTQVISLIAVT